MKKIKERLVDDLELSILFVAYVMYQCIFKHKIARQIVVPIVVSIMVALLVSLYWNN
ncbi:MAG: hypothetical protein M3Z87_14455 [Lactobacillus sp.]|nr:hypothetical protein [Lactobacillus sp.]